MQEIEVKAVRGNAKIKNIESDSALARVLPKNSFVIRNPDGGNTHGEKLVRTLREDWEKYENRPRDHYVNQGGDYRVVRVKEDEDVGGVRDRIARAMGIPQAAVELRLPDGDRANPNLHVGTFRNKWK